MATEDDQQQVQTDQDQPQQAEQPDKLGNEAEALGQKQTQEGGESQTAKNVLAVIAGVAVVALLVWLVMSMM